MSYETPLSKTIPIIDDSCSFPPPPPGKLTGLLPTPEAEARAFRAQPFVSPLPQELYIPRSEWDDRLAEMDANKTSADDLGDHYGVKIKDQDGYGWCWGFGACTSFELNRAQMGLPFVELSASSVCGPVKNYANRGGWGEEAYEYAVQHGWCPVSLWPECPTGANPRYDNEESKAARQAFKPTEFWEVPNRDFDALFSVLLRGWSAAVGLNHWGHLVAACKPVKVNGQYGWKFRNSWKVTWGDNGKGVLLASKAIPDGTTIVPRVATMIAV